jgi:hypothetical protein
MPEEGMNALLEWCSARREGTRRAFRDTYEWLSRDQRPRAANAALHNLEVLGHVEVDWVGGGDWAVAPPAVALLPGSAGNALVAGARSPLLRDRLARACEKRGLAMTAVSQARGPDAWFIAGPTVGALEGVAADCGLAFTHNPSRRYCELLAPISNIIEAARRPFTPGGVEANRFDSASLRFEPFPWRGGPLPPGTYEHRGGGPNTYAVVHEDRSTSVVDRRVAMHYELSRLRDALGGPVYVPLAWNAADETLYCDVRTPLPLLQTRAAVLATGLLPTRTKVHANPYLGDREVDAFPAVGVLVYRAIAESLDVPLPIRSNHAQR